MALTGAAQAEDPRPVDPTVATSKDSGTLDRADADMKVVIAKLMELGAKPVHTLTVETARSQPTPADAAKAVAEDKTGQPPVPESVGKSKISRSMARPVSLMRVPTGQLASRLVPLCR